MEAGADSNRDRALVLFYDSIFMLNLHLPQYQELVRLLNEGIVTFLLVGDYGVGKKTLIRRVLADTEPTANINEYPFLGIDESRTIRRNSLRRSAAKQVILIDGDNATTQAYNALLKILEEPPPATLFFIAASKPPLQTIVSRCHYILVPPLNLEDLRASLLFKGMSERAMTSVLQKAYGSVSEALRVYEKEEQKKRLLSFILALKERNERFVFSEVKTITKDDIVLLIELADDILLSRYGLLHPEYSNVLAVSTEFLFKLKSALSEGNIPSLCWLRGWYATA